MVELNNIDVTKFESNEAQVLSLISRGKGSIKEMMEEFQFSEKHLLKTIEILLSKHIITFDLDDKSYKFDKPIIGERIILDGNIILPMTVFRNKKENTTIISRGKWYKFNDVDFDLRRIIWNVKTNFMNNPNATNQTLVDLIKTTVLKEKKSKNVQVEGWKMLQNKVVPYSNQIGLVLNIIGEINTDIHIRFEELFSNSEKNEELQTMWKFTGFSVPSVIKTEQLTSTLKLPAKERQFKKSIEIDHIFKLSDFIFLGNEIPIKFKNGILEYVKLKSVKKNFEFQYFKVDSNGEKRLYETENYEIEHGINKLREFFTNYTLGFLNNLEFEVEISE
jgi:hypothetical protein